MKIMVAVFFVLLTISIWLLTSRRRIAAFAVLVLTVPLEIAAAVLFGSPYGK
jgi:hypothetical protein